MKKRLRHGALVGALTAGLVMTGTTGASAAGDPVHTAVGSNAAALVCVPNEGENVTREFFGAPRNEISDSYEYFQIRSEWFTTETLPESIAKVDELFGNATPTATKRVLTDVVPTLFARYSEVVEATEAKAEAEGGMTAEIFRETFIAQYAFQHDLTTAVAEAYNTDRVWELQAAWTSSQRFELTYALNQDFINDLPTLYSAYMEIEAIEWAETNSQLPHIYDELHAGFVAAGSSHAEAATQTYNAIYDSTLAWIKRVDLDYLTGYQGQLQQYVAMANAAGLVVHPDPNESDLVMDIGQQGVHDFTLGDFALERLYEFSVDSWFFGVNFNESTGEFFTPEEVYEFAEYQALVTNVMVPLDKIRDGAHDRESVVQAATSTIEEQYSALETPGSDGQPITAEYPSFLDTYFRERDAVFAELPDKTLAVFPDWRDENGDIVYDTYRAPNYIDVPYVVLAQVGTQTVTRDVNFTFEDGTVVDSANSPVSQTTDFGCQVNLFTGELEWVNPSEEYTFPAIDAPVHPAANATVLEVDANLGELVVRPGDKSTVLDVVLPLDFSVDVQFVDADGAQIRDPDRMTGRWNTEFTAVAPEIPGYLLSTSHTADAAKTRDAASATVTGVFNAKTTTVTFEYAAIPETETPGTDGEETPGGSVNPKIPDAGAALANTGGNSLPSAGIGALVLLAAGATLMICRRRA